MTRAAVVPAAGRGERLGPGAIKALRLVAGLPLVVHAVRSLDASRLVPAGVVVAPADACAEMSALVRAQGLDGTWDVVAGGPTRQQSVARGLAALGADVDVVLVHDAARPFVPVAVVRRVVEAIDGGAGAAVPVLAMADTVKEVDVDGAVVATPDRSRLRLTQTPQGFRRAVLEAAYAVPAEGAEGAGRGPASDDASMVERAGGRVVVVPGDPLAFKVTGPLDLVLAAAVAEADSLPS